MALAVMLQGPDLERRSGHRSYRDRVALIVLGLVIAMGLLEKFGPDRWSLEQFSIGLAVAAVVGLTVLLWPPLFAARP